MKQPFKKITFKKISEAQILQLDMFKKYGHKPKISKRRCGLKSWEYTITKPKGLKKI